MSEKQVVVSLEILDKAIQEGLKNYVKNSDKADAVTKKFGKTAKGTFEEIGVHIGKSIGIFDIFVGNLAANLATKAFDTLIASASKLFQTFVVDGVKAAQEQEQAENALNVALAQTGIYSKETALELKRFADGLQATTGVQNDLILKNAALIQNLAQLDKDGLKRATVAALDLSKSLDKDLGTASEALGKAANGNITALQKMGLQIEKGGTNAETFANALQAVENRFGGSSSKIQTYAGAVNLATNQFGQLQESIGETIIKNIAVINVWKEVGKILGTTTDGVKDHAQALREMVGQGIVYVIKGLIGLAAGMDAIIRVFRVATEVLATPFKALAVYIEAAATAAQGKYLQAWDIIKTGVVDSVEEIGKAAGDDTWAMSLGDALSDVQYAAETGLEAVKRGAVASSETLNGTKTKTIELTEEQKKYNQELLNWVENLAKAHTDGQLILDSRIESLTLAREQEKITDEAFFEQKAEAEQVFFDAQQARLEEAKARNIGSDTERVNAQLALDEKRKKAQIKNEIEITKFKQDEEKKRAQNLKSTLGVISTLQQSNIKELFFIGKAAAIAQATIDGIAAVQVALRSAPPPFNFALAGLVGAATAANVAKIAAQPPPAFEQGGIVGGTSFSGDKVTARVNSGEMILNRSQQAELFNIAKGNGGSGLEAKLDRAINLMAQVLSQPFSINIDSRELFNVTRSGLASGRSFV